MCFYLAVPSNTTFKARITKKLKKDVYSFSLSLSLLFFFVFVFFCFLFFLFFLLFFVLSVPLPASNKPVFEEMGSTG